MDRRWPARKSGRGRVVGARQAPRSSATQRARSISRALLLRVEVEVNGVSCVSAGVTESSFSGHRSHRSRDPGVAAPPRNSRWEELPRRTGQAPPVPP
jgi:hypothetical protein